MLIKGNQAFVASGNIPERNNSKGVKCGYICAETSSFLHRRDVTRSIKVQASYRSLSLSCNKINKSETIQWKKLRNCCYRR